MSQYQEVRGYPTIHNNLLYCASTTAYLVNNRYYKTLKCNFEQGLNNYLIRKSYKNTIDYYWKSLQLVDNWKFIYPCIFIQKNCYSSIDKKNKNPEYDFKNKNYLRIYKFLKKKLVNINQWEKSVTIYNESERKNKILFRRKSDKFKF